ncbi:MAG: hypothetical protein A2138_26065 [Deltaproteobacteria bacterium RBG_16_71_12]|nr:MAG: hypothetical protein A2138_26065 [Deltaproteobacteria bacterium RBG_16_71_12]
MVGAITLALGAGLGFGGARMMTVEEPAAPPFIERVARLKERCPGAACAEQLSAVDLKTLLLADQSPQVRELSRRLDECERSCTPR